VPKKLTNFELLQREGLVNPKLFTLGQKKFINDMTRGEIKTLIRLSQEYGLQRGSKLPREIRPPWPF
jgi:reverse gyrase